ncbi:L-amino acid oxidase [Pyrenophora tritici-repentis Pt-1C-BFP]|nr:L-amino acid oxidase [Pyrenophora tritici-repentis Pt-1C-BFP]EDU39560.1 L-amino acid oxidase [Pyrenophora tritici-repentis Pt-1C-BFP]KAI1687215.1 L-amino acid oxidase [Pyrenophora tritici-repentis]
MPVQPSATIIPYAAATHDDRGSSYPDDMPPDPLALPSASRTSRSLPIVTNMVSPSTTAADCSFRSKWASRLIRENIFHELTNLTKRTDHGQRKQSRSSATSQAEYPPFSAPHLSDLFDTIPTGPFDLPKDVVQDYYRVSSVKPDDLSAKHRICIVGAGITGLFIAMILDSLKIPGLEYDILEASDRTGGRIYTHYFSDIPHDYYDIGAMRFPDINIMKSTFKLFKQLNLPVIPYFLDQQSGSVKCPTMYNGITLIDGEPRGSDPFRVGEANGGSVPDANVDDVNKLLNGVYEPFKKAMAADFEEGFKHLMKYDSYTTREMLKNPPPPSKNGLTPLKSLDFFSVQWLETNNTATGLFDKAFSEAAMDSFDFAGPKKEDIKWYCIDGGSSVLIQTMVKTIKQPVQHGKRVQKYTQNSKTKEITVSVAGEPEGARLPYSSVFNTTSLPCLQRIDSTSLDLHPSQKDAIRSLHYDDSAKVAMKFSYPWWITKCGIRSGGEATTDTPLRTCVYPSYNVHDPQDQSATLICSYTWAQDATRIGSLIARYDNELRDLMLDNLARVHLKSFQQQAPTSYHGLTTLDEVRQIIGDAYISHHAWSWSHDPFTSGAFALFGPGKFSNLYPYLTRPAADSRFHICGEASSGHHGWIGGSLDSALASVHKFLRRFDMWEKQRELKDLWDMPPEVEDGVDGTLHLQVALGMIPTSGVVLRNIVRPAHNENRATRGCVVS